MASYFDLTLDTTAPGGVTISLAGGATYTSVRDIVATIGTSDGSTAGYQIKVWGDVDPAADASIQTTEGASAWISYNAAQAVRLSTGDGAKTVNVKVRDSVWNTSSAVSDSITLDTSVPVVTVSGPDVALISKQTGKRTSAFSFTADVDVVAWKVKVVPSNGSLENAGTQIPNTNGSTNMSGGALAAGTPVNATIDGADLEAASAGDGTKHVKVFVQDAAGLWSIS